MNRRNLLQGFALAASGLLIPETISNVTYSFCGGWRKGEIILITETQGTGAVLGPTKEHPWMYDERFEVPDNEKLIAVVEKPESPYFKYTNFNYNYSLHKKCTSFKAYNSNQSKEFMIKYSSWTDGNLTAMSFISKPKQLSTIDTIFTTSLGANDHGMG